MKNNKASPEGSEGSFRDRFFSLRKKSTEEERKRKRKERVKREQESKLKTGYSKKTSNGQNLSHARKRFFGILRQLLKSHQISGLPASGPFRLKTSAGQEASLLEVLCYEASGRFPKYCDNQAVRESFPDLPSFFIEQLMEAVHFPDSPRNDSESLRKKTKTTLKHLRDKG